MSSLLKIGIFSLPFPTASLISSISLMKGIVALKMTFEWHKSLFYWLKSFCEEISSIWLRKFNILGTNVFAFICIFWSFIFPTLNWMNTVRWIFSAFFIFYFKLFYENVWDVIFCCYSTFFLLVILKDKRVSSPWKENAESMQVSILWAIIFPLPFTSIWNM